jgi:Protein of unknown function (DUF1566)
MSKRMQMVNVMLMIALITVASWVTLVAGAKKPSPPPAPVPRTGQTQCSGVSQTIPCLHTGQDGELRAGVAWPVPRFTNNQNGTVTDRLTGLIWLREANCFGVVLWDEALTGANALAAGACGLTDGSVSGDWRLPKVRELYSLIAPAFLIPALVNTAGTAQWMEDDPFVEVQLDAGYWSSTSGAAGTSAVTLQANAWFVRMYDGKVEWGSKTDLFYAHYAWPVRGGQ